MGKNRINPKNAKQISEKRTAVELNPRQLADGSVSESKLTSGLLSKISRPQERNYVLPAIDNLGLTSTAINNPLNAPFSDLRFLHGVERIYFDWWINTQEAGEQFLNPENGLVAIFKPRLFGEQRVWEDRIRAVGPFWKFRNTADGHRILENSDINNNAENAGDYIQITFYGTGCSILTQPSSEGAILDVEVDGVSTGTIDLTLGTNSNTGQVDRDNNYHQYHQFEIPGAKNIAQSLHTVKLTVNATNPGAGSNNIPALFGFDVYNSNPVRLPGRAVIDNEIVTFSSLENVTLPTGGGKGKRAKYYLDTDTRTFKWNTVNAAEEDTQTGTIDFNGASPDQITGLSNPAAYYNVADSIGNIVLITDNVTGNQMLTIPTGISGGILQFADGSFTGNSVGQNYGEDLTDTNACTVELWGKSLTNGDMTDHSQIFKTHFTAWFDYGPFTFTAVDQAFADAVHVLHDNVSAFAAAQALMSSQTNESNLQIGVDDATNGGMKFTFIGTGFAFSAGDDSEEVEVFVDGIEISSSHDFDPGYDDNVIQLDMNNFTVITDLPFGWHTVHFRTTTSGGSLGSLKKNIIILGPDEPTIPEGAIPVAETYLLPDTTTDLGLNTGVDENSRGWSVTNRGAIRHFSSREGYLYGPGWVKSAAIVPGVVEPPTVRFLTDTVADAVEFNFYGEEIGIWFESGAGATGIVEADIDIDGVNVFSGAITSAINQKVEKRFSGLTEEQHNVLVTFTAIPDTTNYEGHVVYGRKTIYPYKPNPSGSQSRGLHGSSSIRDLRPLTPNDRIFYKGQLGINQFQSTGETVGTANQTTLGSRFDRAGLASLFYSETGKIQVSWNFLVIVRAANPTNNVNCLFDLWIDGRRMSKIMVGDVDATEWAITLGPANALQTSSYPIGVGPFTLDIGKGYHVITPTVAELLNPGNGSHFEISDSFIEIKDVE